MRIITEDEVLGKNGYTACKGWSCQHFRLDPFVSPRYCTLEICNFKRVKPDSEPHTEARGISGHFGFHSSQRFGKAWHGNWGE